MCLGTPMRILSIEEDTARCERSNIQRDVNIYLLKDQDLEVGDFVMIHVGYAIQKIDADDALSRWQLFDEMNSLAE